MKKYLFILIVLVFSLVRSPVFANAQMMGNSSSQEGDHTAREEAEGKEVWEKLNAKTIQCQDLSDQDFERLGEYFMGVMMGAGHSAMNEMITRIHGEKTEDKIHVAMGKRLSGCDPNAPIPSDGAGAMPIMQMMWGGWSSPSSNQFNTNMMYGFNNQMGWGFGFLGWIVMILWWVLIIAAVIALVKWILRQGVARDSHTKSGLDILKERYARGEIDKKEFEEKKKDVS